MNEMNKTSWKLWLDDQINDLETPVRWAPEGFIGAGSTEEAKKLVVKNGPPGFMDLDHDLGGDDTAMIFLNWLFSSYGCEYPPDYNVHSENPIGRDNIVSFMKSWKKSIG